MESFKMTQLHTISKTYFKCASMNGIDAGISFFNVTVVTLKEVTFYTCVNQTFGDVLLRMRLQCMSRGTEAV